MWSADGKNVAYLRSISPEWDTYDEPLLAFGRKRSDNSQSVLITLLNRHLVLTRFTPRLSYTFTRQSSSISLYEFKRSRLEIGLTTVF